MTKSIVKKAFILLGILGFIRIISFVFPVSGLYVRAFYTANRNELSYIVEHFDDINTNNFYKIVLVHEPDSIDNIINYNPNLILAGDTLGGLIKIPLFKPLFLNEYSQKYYKPYYKIKDTEIYINNGLGTSYINARLNNVPSINFYRLNKIKE